MLDLLPYPKPAQELEHPHRVCVHRACPQEDAILEEARRRLTSQGFGELFGLECECGDGKLTLRGHVSSFYLKQLAQEAIRTVRGIKTIVNAIEVESRYAT